MSLLETTRTIMTLCIIIVTDISLNQARTGIDSDNVEHSNSCQIREKRSFSERSSRRGRIEEGDAPSRGLRPAGGGLDCCHIDISLKQARTGIDSDNVEHSNSCQIREKRSFSERSSRRGRIEEGDAPSRGLRPAGGGLDCCHIDISLNQARTGIDSDNVEHSN